MYNQAENLAYDLRLIGIKNEMQRRCEAGIAANQHPSEVIRLLLEDEKMHRKQATAKRLVLPASDFA